MAQHAQKTIDFDRLRRINALAAARIPTPPANWYTSAAVMKQVLQTIDDMTGMKDAFRVKSAQIAERLQLSLSATKRALVALQKLGLIDATRTGRASVYAINWPALAELDERAKAQSAPSEGAECAIRRRTVRPLKAQSAPSDLLPKPFTKTLTVSRSQGAGWEEAAAALRACDVRAIGSTLAAARERGISADTVVAIAEHWRQHPGAWSVGLLCWRIRDGRPEWSASEGWPEPAETHQRQQQKAAAVDEQARRRAEWEAREAEHAAARRELEQLERAYGAELDRLTRAEINQLAESALDELQLRAFRQFGPAIMRRELLAALAAARASP